MPPPFDQLDEPQEVIQAKVGTVTGKCDERVTIDGVRPTGGKVRQATLRVLEVDAVFTPGLPIGQQLKLLAKPRVVGVGDPKKDPRSWAIGCS